MISFFKKAKQWDSLPPKSHTVFVILLFFSFIILYVDALVLYLLLAFYKDEAVQRICLLTSAIIEIVITVFSILISLIATKVSDHYSNACIESIKYVNRQNSPLFNNDGLLLQEQKLDKKRKIVYCMRCVVLIPFAIYLACMLNFLIGVNSTPVQIVTSVTGAISAICSIILALTSTFYCAITGQNTNLLLSKLVNDNIKIADLYNNLLIDQSFSDNP